MKLKKETYQVSARTLERVLKVLEENFTYFPCDREEEQNNKFIIETSSKLKQEIQNQENYDIILNFNFSKK